jgi:arachidonate 15-lipoxygenase
MPSTLPSLPQHATPAEREAREFQLSLARTEYNYMRSYLEGVPMSADLPDGEKFSLDFGAQVLKVLHVMLKNFTDVVMLLLRRELESDMPADAIKAVE